MITPDEILNDIGLAVDLIAKIKNGIANAKGELSAETIEQAKAGLLKIQQDATQADVDFDAAVKAARERG